jgi:DNA-directed RNA polymerase subunit RPC12/RpoP
LIEQSVRAWLLLAVGDDRQHGGNDGYDDEPDVHYSWDSTVPNHGSLQKGDLIALWDKRRLIGVSTIEDISKGSKEKLLYRCSECGLAGIKSRKTKFPRYKCYECKAEFENPTSKVEQVTTYRSRHDAGWKNLDGVLSGPELRELCESPKSQLSLRPLRWADFAREIAARAGLDVVGQVERRSPSTLTVGGHSLATVRVRRGQRAFRENLLQQYGPRCAFTGDAPASVLEAGHLYSYASLGTHHEHGGLLLRRDIHRLFDDGHLAVNPRSLRASVSPTLLRFPQYAALHDRPLTVNLKPTQIRWLTGHWNLHRTKPQGF